MPAGPTPLGLYLAAAMAITTTSLNALPLLRSGWKPWSEKLRDRGENLQASLDSVEPDALATAVLNEAAFRHQRYLVGLGTYRKSKSPEKSVSPPHLWRDGDIQLLDYGTVSSQGGGGQPVLIVPSLINRSRILDLMPDRSLLRYLAALGFRPLLVDWRPSGTLDRSLDSYIADDLVSALDVAYELAGNRGVPVVGYCMGGTLALALAALSGARVSALALLAAPWDFHAPTGQPQLFVTAAGPALEAIIASLGYLPVEVIQSLFFSIDPIQNWRKFRRFAELPADGPDARLFVALEDWLNDGVRLSAPVARECLFGWYRDNLTVAGQWQVAGTAVDPKKLKAPALVVVPAQDRIVPPDSALAILKDMPHAECLMPGSGHIGMMVGSGAEDGLWKPLSNWLGGLP